MAKEYTMQMPSHNSIYRKDYVVGNYEKRKTRVDYCLPSSGVNESTGILLLIAGFGANIDSKVYKKMRTTFADKYNLVTIQCEYFGSKFMQTNYNFLNESCIANGLDEGQRSFTLRLDESPEDFNEMSIMQAIDNINAVISVIESLRITGAKYNSNKVIIYGNSHGSYLAYLCNRFAPGLFTLIIDNSAWITPAYINKNRFISFNNPVYGSFGIIFEYLVSYEKECQLNKNLYDLMFLYQDFENACHIVSCHGVKDTLVTIQEKRKLLSTISNMVLIEIEEEDVDGKLFTTAEHGLGADFLELFDIIFSEFVTGLSESYEMKQLQNVSITYDNNKKVLINYSDLMPQILLD